MALTDWFIRTDGRLRGPAELIALGRGLWIAARVLADPSPAPAEREATVRRALEILHSVGATDPLLRGARMALSIALQDQGRSDDAAEVARHLTERPDALGAGAWWIGARYLQLGRPDRALAPSFEALEAARASCDPALRLDAVALRASVLLHAERPEEARIAVDEGRRIIAAHPELPPGHGYTHDAGSHGVIDVAWAQVGPRGR